MVRSLIKKVLKSLTSGKKAPTEKTESAPPSAAAEKSPENEFRPGQRPSHPGRKERSSGGPRREGGREDRPPRHHQADDQERRGRNRRRGERPHQENKPGEPKPERRSHAAPETPRADRHEGWSLKDYDIPVSAGKTRFYDLNIHDRLLHAVADLGFQYCTPIQAEVLPYTLTGRDAFGQAQTGTGKTAAFVLATLDYFLRHPRQGEARVGRPRALVIAPTRELVMQIYNDAVALGKYTEFEFAVLFGGMDYEKQQRQLQNKVIDMVCATPGRLLDFKRRGDLDLGGVEVLILDEADRMLDMGFIPDVREIVHSTPPKHKRQTLFFSATFTDEIKRLATQWTKDPVTITITPESVAVDTVEQVVYIVTLNERFALVHHILSRPDMERAIIFVNRRYEAEKLADQLHRYGFQCDLLSGAVPQNKRMRTLEMFKEGKLQVLVATDVAGRGLHVEGVSHVINFSLPEDPEDYVHRIGRTGRAGATGISISFATEDDAYNIPAIEKFIGRSLPCTHPEDGWLVLPEPPSGVKAPLHRSTSRPPRPNRPGGRGGPRPGGRPGGGRRPPRKA
ncbi:MAG TPA: DEAD/DEAH box helicase [Kiritimatiellia bacterium]|nr:DEAD/DEAH box helicase [Kiritimatiellia bacterium]HMO98012.1 DEAD/DEAH box helicase [Kiritimatiellia bacterium]HMP95362.1 DEAD/DEAH box helicase [Kiritimatiellia bacterium]